MNKLIYFKFLAALLTTLWGIQQASAYNFAKDGIYYVINGTNAYVTYKDTNYNSYSGTVNIPSTVTNNGTTYNVVQINPSAFKDCVNLKRVVLPPTINYLMNYAFQNCTGLTDITLPANFYSCYNYVFDGCTNLKSIICLSPTPHNWNANNLPSTVLSNATLIVPQGKKAAYESVSGCLSSFSDIQEMDCDFAVDAIFYKDLGDNKASVTHALRFAEDYSGDITIPQTVTHGGTTYTVTTVGNEAFYDCHNLYSVVLPQTVNSISNYAFYYCNNLTNVNIPEGVQYINYCTFGACASLQDIIIPSSVTWIAQKAFSDCQNLTNITCRATTPPTCDNTNTFPSQAYTNATLNVSSKALSAYQTADVWKNFTHINAKDYDLVDNGIYYRITGSGTVEVTYKDTNFNYYSGHVTIPSTVTYGGVTYTVVGIGRSAFRSSPDLTSVSIPSSVTYIDYGAFYQCTGLTQISIPSKVATLGEFAFMNCSGLTTVYMHNSAVTVIPRQCFTSCSSLGTITFPATLKDISYFAFYGCEGLSSVSLPQGLESIQYAAFEGCGSLTSVSIPSSVTYIGGGAFSDCNSMVSYDVNSMNQHYKSVDGVLFDMAMDTLLLYPNMHAPVYEVPNSVTVIGTLAFSGCNNVTSVTLPWGVRYIDSSAFASCTNLEAIEIPTSVEYIGSSAFTGCQQLESILIPESVTYIGDNALSRCTNLRSIDVEKNNTNYKSDYGVLYTMDGHKLIQYPCARPDKHYSVLNTTDTIGQSAFAYSNVQSVYLPKSLRSLGYEPFAYSKVERVVIDEGLEIIPMNAFFDCEQMKSIYLPSTIKEIKNQAFVYTFGLEQLTIAVDGEAPVIGDNAFYGMGYETATQYTTVYVPNGMETQYAGKIEWTEGAVVYSDIVPLTTGSAFTVDSLNMETTDSLLNVKVTGVTAKTFLDPGIPPKVAVNGNLCTVTNLGYNSLQNCTRMVRAEVPFTVTWMDDYSFYGCTNIQELRLRDGVKQIDPFSVSHINAMTTLTIPASVDSISGTFVNYSYGLKEIAVDKDNAKYTSVNGVLFSRGRKRLVAYPYAHGTEYIVPQGTEVIASSSFRGSALTQVTLPTTLRTIEGTAFFDNQSLTSVVVPRGVVTIGNSAFGSCTAMTSAELPETLTSLGYNAFYNVPHLTSLTVKNPVPPTCVIHNDPRTHTISYPFMDIHFTQCTLYVPRGSKAAYQAANIWKNFTNIVEIDLPVEAKRGDVNGDGQVTISDVTALIDYLLGGGIISTEAADVNLDNGVTISDVTTLIDYLLGGQWPATGRLDLWYLIGDNVGSQPWENNGQNSVGRGLLPLYPVGEFDSNGKGRLQYTGYFGANEAVMLIHNPGRFDDCWGYTPTGVFGFGGDDITAVSTGNDGYYTIMMYNNPDRFYFTPYSASTPISFNSINIVGPHSNWDVTNSEYNMTPLNPGKENHNWIFRDFTTASDIEIKIAANNWWEYNWGVEQFPWGRGERNGNNIPVEAGTYDVYFNDITGDFHFIKK